MRFSKIIRFSGTAACALILASAAHAQEGGEVVLEIGGESVVFPLWNSQSDWSGSEHWATVNIYTRPTDETAWESYKGFTLGFELVNGVAQYGEVDLTTADGDELTRYYGEEGETDLTLTVESYDVSGELLTLSGEITATMGTSETFGSDIDLSDPRDIAGTFTVTLGPVE